MLHTMEATFGDLEDRTVADLGCGCGVLSLGAVMMGAAFVHGFDIDQDALAVFQTNLEGVNIAYIGSSSILSPSKILRLTTWIL